VRGLELLNGNKITLIKWSHPSRVRGLEQKLAKKAGKEPGRTLHGCVGWNVAIWATRACSCASHPSRVRGLEPETPLVIAETGLSHPSRVRGLEPLWSLHQRAGIQSHLHGCVGWNSWVSLRPSSEDRRTFTGAWVGTGLLQQRVLIQDVAPSRVRGLERDPLRPTRKARRVAPSRVRGLEPSDLYTAHQNTMSHLHGCVGWN